MVSHRLITCGTVEEKIYRKQVYKGALFRMGTEEGIQTAYFSSQVHTTNIACQGLIMGPPGMKELSESPAMPVFVGPEGSIQAGSG